MAEIPKELTKPYWEGVKKELPDPYNKDTAVATMLTGIEAANAGVDWQLLEDAVEDANKSANAQEREKVIAAARAQFAKLDSFTKAIGNFKATIGRFKISTPGLEDVAKMIDIARHLEQFVAGFKQQMTTKLKNSESDAERRASALSLSKALANPAISDKLHAFMKKEHTDESYDFLVAFKSGQNKALYDRHVKKGDLNLPHAAFEDLKAFYEPPKGTAQKPDSQAQKLWQEAFKQIFALVERDSFPRFISSL